MPYYLNMPNELAYCEIYKPRCHGVLNSGIDSSHVKYIYSSILYQYGISPASFLDRNCNDCQEWEEVVVNQYSLWRRHDNQLNYNPIIRNTSAIRPNCLHIVEKIEVGDYLFCIIKTFWLKIIQRKWKRWYHNMLSKRKNPRYLILRQIYGRGI